MCRPLKQALNQKSTLNQKGLKRIVLNQNSYAPTMALLRCTLRDRGGFSPFFPPHQLRAGILLTLLPARASFYSEVGAASSVLLVITNPKY